MDYLTEFRLQLNLGDNVTLRFSLSDDDPLVQTEDISWFFISSGIRTDITNSSDSRHTLSADRLSFLIDGITHSDEGEYLLEATNAAGTGSNSVILSVTGDVFHFFIKFNFSKHYRYSIYYRWS